MCPYKKKQLRVLWPLIKSQGSCRLIDDFLRYPLFFDHASRNIDGIRKGWPLF